MIKKYNYVPFLDDGESVVYNNFYYWEAAFSDIECDKIIELGNSYHIHDASVEGQMHNNTSVENKIRRSKISWIPFQDNSSWIYEKIHNLANLTNKNMNWNFSLYGFFDGLQFTEYNSEYKGHYDFHSDIVTSNTVRKMSVVLQLSEDQNYEGGNFELFQIGNAPRKRGTLIFFPSFIVHRVLPVTKGLRHSLVAWIVGPKFV